MLSIGAPNVDIVNKSQYRGGGVLVVAGVQQIIDLKGLSKIGGRQIVYLIGKNVDVRGLRRTWRKRQDALI